MSNTTNIQWSEFQTNIFDHVEHRRGNLIVDAVAGSGKTTVIVEALNRIPRGNGFIPPAILVTSFARSIVDTIAKRVPSHVSCKGLHALGRAALVRYIDDRKTTSNKDWVSGRKVPKIVFSLTSRDNPDVRNIFRLVSLAKSVLLPDFTAITQQYELDFVDPQKSVDIAKTAFDRSIRDLSSIDFDDMLYLPVLLNAEFDEQDWVFVDEAQDVNDIQLEILERLAKAGQPSNGIEKALVSLGGRMVSPTIFTFVGDPFQAIYAFRGANADSLDRIAKRFSCSTLPLSYSYRCPRLVVQEAQKYCK